MSLDGGSRGHACRRSSDRKRPCRPASGRGSANDRSVVMRNHASQTLSPRPSHPHPVHAVVQSPMPISGKPCAPVGTAVSEPGGSARTRCRARRPPRAGRTPRAHRPQWTHAEDGTYTSAPMRHRRPDVVVHHIRQPGQVIENRVRTPRPLCGCHQCCTSPSRNWRRRSGESAPDASAGSA